MSELDIAAAQSWIYPSNCPYREYQKTMVQAALFKNTMVCLPTGLGKTLIAAVVMYNYYLWFPRGLIIFMAPTKPLVSQQIEACHSVVGIPEHDTAHLFGAVSPENREQYWQDRRVVFCTPQSLHNDLVSGICNGQRIVCLVFDEAHRATGNYAYCQIIRLMESRGHSNYRVLALTATPGNDSKAIQKVVYNLKIAAVEVRGEDDEDVAQYTNLKQIEIIKCKPSLAGSASDFAHVKMLFNDLIRPLVKHLFNSRCFISDASDNLTEFIIREGEDNLNRLLEYQRIDVQSGRRLAACLRTVGCFVRWKHKIVAVSKADSRHSSTVITAMSGLLEYMTSTESAAEGNSLDLVDVLPTVRSDAYRRMMSFLQNCVQNRSFSSASNEKLEKLEAILTEHFKRFSAVKGEGSTRSIVFCATRSSVQDCVVKLSRSSDIRAVAFVGQTNSKSDSRSGEHSKGINQQEQESILEAFRAGRFNVLVATCIAEEGLDIGEVDLIVCFDSVSSPLRLMQRMGRTGRKRAGRVVMLVVEGKDSARVDQSGISATSVLSVLKNSASKLRLNQSCPRMLPEDVEPFFQLKELSVNNFDRGKVGGLKPKPVTSSVSQLVESNLAVQQQLRWQIEANIAQSNDQVQWHNFNEIKNAGTFSSGFWDSLSIMEEARTVENDKKLTNFPAQQILSSPRIGSVTTLPCLICGQKSASSKQLCNECIMEALDSVELCEPTLLVTPDTAEIAQLVEALPEPLEEQMSRANKQSDSSHVYIYPVEYLEFVKSITHAQNECQQQSPQFAPLKDKTRGAETMSFCFRNTGLLSKSVYPTKVSQSIGQAGVSSPSCLNFSRDHKLNSSPSGVWDNSLSPNAVKFPNSCRSHSIAETCRVTPLRLSLKVDYNVMLAQRYSSTVRSTGVSDTDAEFMSATLFQTAPSFQADSTRLNQRITMPLEQENIATVAKKIFVLPSSSSEDEDDNFFGTAKTYSPVVRNSSKCDNRLSPISNHQASPLLKHDLNMPSVDQAVKLKKLSMIDQKNKVCSDAVKIYPLNAPVSTTASNKLPHDQEELIRTVSIHRAAPKLAGLNRNCGYVKKCGVCTSSEFSLKDPLLTCSVCEECSHVSCYGLFAAPRTQWKCEFCILRQVDNHSPLPKCELCKCSTGLLRKIDGKFSLIWVHPICVIFIPELTLDTRSMRANNLDNIDRDRDTLCCALCRRFGACIQCTYKECRAAIHPYCAFRSSKQLVVKCVSSRNAEIKASPDNFARINIRRSQSQSGCSSVSDDDFDNSSTYSYHYYCDLHLLHAGNDGIEDLVSSTIPIAATDGTTRPINKMLETTKNNCKDVTTKPCKLPKSLFSSPDLERKLEVGVSPFDCQDTPESIAKLKQAAIQRIRLLKFKDQACKSVQLPRKSDSSKKRKREERKKIRRQLRRFIEDEASCSERDSCIDGDSNSEEEKMSGDFINDGTYTQASPHVDNGLSMYHALHKKFMDDSPEISIIDRLRGARHSNGGAKDTVSGTFSDGDEDILSDSAIDACSSSNSVNSHESLTGISEMRREMYSKIQTTASSLTSFGSKKCGLKPSFCFPSSSSSSSAAESDCDEAS